MARLLLVLLLLHASSSSAAAVELGLRQVVEMAQSQNLDLRAARARLEAAAAAARSARGALGPQVRAGATLSLWDRRVLSSPDAVTATLLRDQATSVVSLSVTQQLGGLFSQVERARSAAHLAEAAAFELQAARTELCFQTIEAYLRLLEAGDLRGISEQGIRELEEGARAAAVLVRQGVLIEADLLHAQVALAQARLELLRREAALDLARAYLAALLGLPVWTEITPLRLDDLPIPRPPPSLAGALAPAGGHPEVAAARSRALSQVAARRAAGGDLAPGLSLGVSYLRSDGLGPVQPRDAAQVSAQLSWTLWDWGAQYYALQAARARATQSEIDLQRRRRDVELEIARSYLEARAATAALAVTGAAVAQAEEAHRVTAAQFRHGGATTTELLRAQVALADARVSATRARYGALVAHAALQRAQGAMGLR